MCGICRDWRNRLLCDVKRIFRGSVFLDLISKEKHRLTSARSILPAENALMQADRSFIIKKITFYLLAVISCTTVSLRKSDSCKNEGWYYLLLRIIASPGNGAIIANHVIMALSKESLSPPRDHSRFRTESKGQCSNYWLIQHAEIDFRTLLEITTFWRWTSAKSSLYSWRLRSVSKPTSESTCTFF